MVYLKTTTDNQRKQCKRRCRNERRNLPYRYLHRLKHELNYVDGHGRNWRALDCVGGASHLLTGRTLLMSLAQEEEAFTPGHV